MRFALLCLILLSGTATADSVATTHEPSPVSYTLGADAQLAVGQMIATRLAARFELEVVRGHSLVARGGVGNVSWFETEIDDPTYRERMLRFGYRVSSPRWFAGAEFGVGWLKAEYAPEEQMNHDPKWFNDFTASVLGGLRAGPVRVSLDYTHDFTSPVRQVGLQLGVDFVRL